MPRLRISLENCEVEITTTQPERRSNHVLGQVHVGVAMEVFVYQPFSAAEYKKRFPGKELMLIEDIADVARALADTDLEEQIRALAVSHELLK